MYFVFGIWLVLTYNCNLDSRHVLEGLFRCLFIFLIQPPSLMCQTERLWLTVTLTRVIRHKVWTLKSFCKTVKHALSVVNILKLCHNYCQLDTESLLSLTKARNCHQWISNLFHFRNVCSVFCYFLNSFGLSL